MSSTTFASTYSVHRRSLSYRHEYGANLPVIRIQRLLTAQPSGTTTVWEREHHAGYEFLARTIRSGSFAAVVQVLEIRRDAARLVTVVSDAHRDEHELVTTPPEWAAYGLPLALPQAALIHDFGDAARVVDAWLETHSLPEGFSMSRRF